MTLSDDDAERLLWDETSAPDIRHQMNGTGKLRSLTRSRLLFIQQDVNFIYRLNDRHNSTNIESFIQKVYNG